MDRRTLFVQGIPPNASREDIWDAFVIFGELSNVEFISEKKTALVEFMEEGDATAALDNMHLSEIYGNTIFVSYATKGNFVDRRKPIWELEFQAGEP